MAAFERSVKSLSPEPGVNLGILLPMTQACSASWDSPLQLLLVAQGSEPFFAGVYVHDVCRQVRAECPC